jgi:phosphodiesterase/alkaline phosphatase D-like protein
MNRKEFLQVATAGTLAAGWMASTAGAQTNKADDAPAALQFTSSPVLTNVGDDGLTVIVGVNQTSAAKVEYGETPELGQVAYGAAGGLRSYADRVHKIRLTGLKPGAKYHYRVVAQQVKFHNAYKIERSAEIADQTREFRTLNSRGDNCRFVIWNDTHDRAETLAAVHAATEKLRPDFLVWNGDISNDISSEEQITRLFLSPGKDLPYAANTPLMLVRGNHDVRGAAARELPRYTDTPGELPYYSFRHGPVAMIVLDTGEDKPDDHPVYAGLNDFRAFRAMQRQWLASEIKKPEVATAPIRVVCCHIPLAWSRPQDAGWWCADGCDQWHDLLVQAGVSLVISGHTHQWAHLPPEGDRPYHQLIGGGPALAQATYILGECAGGKLIIDQRRLQTDASLAKIELPAA